MARIVETDNFDGDYPAEEFVLFPMGEEIAEQIVGSLNEAAREMSVRYRWKVVGDNYKLQPGFEP